MSVGDRLAILRNGGIQQIGAPPEVYDSPRNDYVARMLGQPTLNLIKVRRDPASNRLTSADGAFEFGAGANGAATVGLRPENVTLTPIDQAGPGPAARVSTIEPLGGFTVVNIEVDGADAGYRVLLRGQPALTVGQAMKLGYAPDAALWFDQDGNKLEREGKLA